jgi:hypothetical protein
MQKSKPFRFLFFCFSESVQASLTSSSKQKKQSLRFAFSIHRVQMKGLEPPRRETPDPKSGAATNYATSAFNRDYKFSTFFEIMKLFS